MARPKQAKKGTSYVTPKQLEWLQGQARSRSVRITVEGQIPQNPQATVLVMLDGSEIAIAALQKQLDEKKRLDAANGD